jgi:hypothetical protein
MKVARILDWGRDTFGLEYDNTVGRKHTMSLEAVTYEKAVREAKSFLGIQADNYDSDGTLWDIE